MLKLSTLIQGVRPSPTFAAAARAQALKNEGKDVISFSLGEPDFDTPEHVKKAAKEALDKGFTKYTATEGFLPLREALVQKFKRDQGLSFSSKQIIVSNGGKQAIAGVMASILDPGDEVIIPSPYWTSYPDMTVLLGAQPVAVTTRAEDGYVLKPEALEKAITAKTRMLILNSPSNPTGGCYREADLKALAEVLRTHRYGKQVLVLSDEVYEYITYGDYKHASIAQVAPDLSEQIVIVNAFSKAYSMTGWRVGYAAGPEHVIKAAGTHQSQITSNVCSVAQYAASKAYEDNYAFPRMMAQAFTKRLGIVVEAIKRTPGLSLPVSPLGAFYAFPRVEGLIGKSADGRQIRSGTDFTNYLLEKYHVVAVQGEAFGDVNAFRLSFAMAEDRLQVAMARISEAAASLK